MLLIVLSLILSISSAQNEPPFCTLCRCINDDSNHFEVTCTKDVRSYIFDKSSWVDHDDNTTYSYSKITIQNSPILSLNQQFPASNIVYLNLANNSIVNISDDVFQNLQNMQVLDLSYNNIELLHPNAFDVSRKCFFEFSKVSETLKALKVNLC